jgi:hypothetical protein
MFTLDSAPLTPNENGLIAVRARAQVKLLPDIIVAGRATVGLQLRSLAGVETNGEEIKSVTIQVEADTPEDVQIELAAVLPKHLDHGPPGVAGEPWEDPETIVYRFVIVDVTPGTLTVNAPVIEQITPPARVFIRYRREVREIPSITPGVQTEVVFQPYWYYPPQPPQHTAPLP